VAREVIIRIRDDLDPESLADKTITFGAHGTTYEIDVTAAHAEEFDAVLARWVAAARVVMPEKPSRRKPAAVNYNAPSRIGPDYRQQRRRIREWAHQTGYQLADKGLLARDIIKAYAATHPNDPILPGTWHKGHGRKPGQAPAVESITAQQGNEQSALAFMEDVSEQEHTRYLAAKAKGGGGNAAKAGAIPDKALRDKIRTWAIEQGLPCNYTGILRKEIVDAYRNAHQ